MNFHRYWIYGLFLLLFAGCVSCSMGGKKPEADRESVSDMASNCENGMKRGATKERGERKESEVECFPPAEIIRYVR